MMNNAVEVRDLRVVRGGNEVLRGLDFTVRAGEVTGLLGPSGSGKTTLMRSLVGVQRITAGSVEVFGRPAGAPSLRAEIGYVTQDPTSRSPRTSGSSPASSGCRTRGSSSASAWST